MDKTVESIVENIINNEMKVLVIGDIMLDEFVSGDISRLSPEAPVPVLSNMVSKYQLGGAANVCKNLASIGVKVDLMGAIGADFNSDIVLQLLKESNISTEFIYQISDYITTTKTRFTSKDGNQILRIDREKVFDFSKEFEASVRNTIKCIINEYNVVILSDYAKGFLSISLTKEIIRKSNLENVKVIVDPKGNNFSKYKGSYLVKPNLSEFRQFIKNPNISISEIIDNSEKILKMLCVSRLLITCGDNGIILLRKDKKPIYNKAVASLVRDVTGAGDVVTALSAIGIALDLSEEIYIGLANYCAGMSVCERGTSIINFNDFKSFFGPESKVLNNHCSLKKLRDCCIDKKIVFTNGCFDIFHVGHIDMLKRCKEVGDVLVVGVNADCSISNLKGEQRPINDLNSRVMLLANLPFVDWIIPYNTDSPLKIIKMLNPDVLIKGDDYKKNEIIGAKYIEKTGGQVILMPHHYDISTTNIIQKIISKENIR